MANKNEEIKEKEKDKKLKNNQNIFKIDNQLVDKNIIKEKYKIKNKSKNINNEIKKDENIISHFN